MDLSDPWLYRLQDSSRLYRDDRADHGPGQIRLKKLDQRRRETVPASELLILGMQCGGSDAFSGITANPALGYASDLLLRAGATVMFSKSPKCAMPSTCPTSRARSGRCSELVREMDWYDRYLAKGEADRSAEHHAR